MSHHHHRNRGMRPGPNGWEPGGNKPYPPPSSWAVAFVVLLIFLIGYTNGDFLAGVN